MEIPQVLNLLIRNTFLQLLIHGLRIFKLYLLIFHEQLILDQLYNLFRVHLFFIAIQNIINNYH